ncbi:LOW QUALITY PROTEIN: uncharacterized protein [Amphiura filiformis]|uniref:LOW QUALITY PROTEIN: uncharacterized protein n=1 Tax=Amphiura filiformis TaxID=82378 RepID=UPI003B226AA1
MDSERTRNLKELRQKRLQYYDKLQPQSSKAANSHPTGSTDRQKITHKQTQPSTSRRSILAWDSPDSSPKSSPSLRKKQSIQNAPPSSTQNSTPFQSRIGNSAQYRSSSDRKDESYVSPMRRSLSHAQSFSTTPQRNTLNRDEFSYSYQDFRPVERERYFSTKPVEDVSWPPHTTSAGKAPRREANVSSNRKISSTESSRQVHKSSIRTDDITFDADYVENILQEMTVVREMKTQVHDELKTNFDNHNGKTPFTKYDHVSTKYGNDAPHSATKYGHNHTKEGDDIDIDHSTHRTFDLSKQQDSRSSELSSDQNLEDDQVKISEQTSNIKLTYRIGNDNEGKEKKEESEEEGDEDFNLGALQKAAKQGDDILRRYIKRLSQRLHSKAVDEHTSGDNTSLGQSLERKPVEEQRSGDDRYTRFEPGPGSAPWEERVGNDQHGGLEENNNEIDASFIQSHNEHHFESKLNDVTDLVKESIPRKEFIDGNHEGITECNHVTEDEDHVTEKSDHVTNYQPKIAQPAMTSSKLQELGLLDDIFSSTLNLQSNAIPAADKQLDAEQIVDPIDTKSEEFQLQTHRPGHRPVSPLKNVRTNSSLSEKTQNLEFSYVHVPDASESISDMDIEIHHNVNMNSDSSESDKVSNKNKHPKPPEVAKKPTSSLRRVHHANSSSSNALNKPSNPKRVKTPERHVVGIREHHEKERDVRKQTNNISPRRGATSPTRGQFNEKSPGRAPVNQKVSVVTSSFLRGVTPEPKAELLSVPSLDFHDDDDGDHHEDQMALFDDMVGDGGVDETGQEDDNETVLMQRITDFKPPFGGANQMDASGDAPNRNWHPQVSFELPHQEAIDDLLGRASDTEKRKVCVPNARPSSAGPSRSTSGVLHRGRPSSAKSKVSQYMDGSTQFKRRWATPSSLWGRSINAGGDLEVAGQRSKVTDGSSKSPTLVRKARPGSAKHVGAGDADMVGSRMKGQRSRPWSAGYGGNTQKEDFLNVGASQLRDGQVVRALDSYANRAVPPLTMQLIVESPRTSEGISVWQLLPDEILLHIFTYLSHYDLTQCAQTCSFFNRIVLDDSLWRHIHLEKKVLTDFGLTQIGERHPTHLGFVQCTGNITENGLRNLFRSCAESLKELNVSGCSNGELSGDSLLLHASRCYNLKRLDASWCSVTDNGLTAINDSIHQLNSLCLNGCREVSDQCLRAVIEKHGKSLSVLEVFGCFNLSTDSLMFIGDTCKHLRTLNIGQCYKLTDESIANLAPHIKGVRHLDLRGCKQIRDWCIRKIVRHCKKLESLVLANCSHIGNTALNEIATYLPNMRHIDLAGCKRVTNEGVKALATNCHQLTTLDISSTGIDHRSVTALASYCSKSLQGIKLNCCKEITEASIVKLLKHCKQLETLHLYGVKRLHTLSVLKLQYPCLMYDEKSRAPPRFRQSES